ncbi:MAG: C4-type zinc ribbon domain-containing protein [Deltaproteobacteria bacterium]
MREQINLLVELQDKDQTLDRLRWQIRQGPEQLQDLERQISKLEEDIAFDRLRVQEVQKAQRQYEADMEDAVAHMRKSRGRLMTIKSNKEYRALLREIEETEKSNAVREDKVLACLEELEELTKEIEAKGERLSVLRDRLRGEEITIRAEMADLQEELSAVASTRAKLIENIDARLLARYERIKARSGGIAIALVNNATCSECHLGIPPQMYNELQKQDTVQLCPNCQRIIYWKGGEPVS